MKRKTRVMSQKTRDKISKKLTGRKKSAIHKARIAESMRRYWQTIPPEINE